MKLEINDNRKIIDIQEEFSVRFKAYRIEFYEKPDKNDGPGLKQLVRVITKTIGECRTKHNSGSVSISTGMTVGELKRNLETNFGLEITIQTRSEYSNMDGKWVSDQDTFEEEQEKKPVSTAKID